LVGWLSFRYDTFCANGSSLSFQRRTFKGTANYDRKEWHQFTQPPRGIKPVHDGHRNVQDHGVGLQFRGFCQTLFAVRGFAANFEVNLFINGALKAATYGFTVIYH
jgi:hypothetical protein